MNLKGTVEAVKQRDKGYSILVAGDWYGGRGTLPCNKGDEVEFEWETSDDGKWKNISEIEVTSSAPVEPSGQELGLRKKLALETTLKVVEVLKASGVQDIKPSNVEAIATELLNTALKVEKNVFE